ncbi:MAG: inositol monophosphatase [Bacteroidetes bacterium HGW-Bacteroidetes-15]|nr:MAG: inositol monophosphatase [Bacteroidetes bacterium HGW-Bacteroidetes-15]
MNLEHICNQVVELSKSTGQFIREQRNHFTIDRIETKGLHDFVSYVDKESETRLVEGLKQILPEAGYIAEEGTGSQKPGGLNWVIDPLDGTTNFIHGLPPYAISIALMDADKVILGVIYEVTLNECFYAWGNGKAYLNGHEIKVSSISRVNDSLIATGFPYYDYDRIEPFFQTMEYFIRYSHGMRRLGSAATDLAYVACGRFEAFYEYSLQPWDVAAGAFIVEQAGGKVCDFSGKKNHIFGKEIIASNSNVFKPFFDIISKFMSNPNQQN